MTKIEAFESIMNVILSADIVGQAAVKRIGVVAQKAKDTLEDTSVFPALDLIIKKCNGSSYGQTESTLSYVHKAVEKVLSELYKRNNE